MLRPKMLKHFRTIHPSNEQQVTTPCILPPHFSPFHHAHTEFLPILMAHEVVRGGSSKVSLTNNNNRFYLHLCLALLLLKQVFGACIASGETQITTPLSFVVLVLALGVAFPPHLHEFPTNNVQTSS